MPLAPPNQIALDTTRAPALPEAASLRPERVSAATSEFTVGTEQTTVEAPATGAASSDSFRRFEAMVLQNFIQNMLPKDSAAVYGKGMAGDMWKSLLAEKMADAMSERGGIGIASRMLGQHYSETPGTADAATFPTAAAERSDAVSARVQQQAASSISPVVLESMQLLLSDLLTGVSGSAVSSTQSRTKNG